MYARELPLSGARMLASSRAPVRFDMVGLHWQGSGHVLFRTRKLSGRWSRWQAADADTLPDASSAEFALARRWHLGGVVWTSPSDRIEWRAAPGIRRLRAFFVWSPPILVPERTVSLAGSPAIVPRVSWGANEKIRRGPPLYAPAVRMAIVHHTAGSNGYTPAQSAAIVRGIELYHVRANGWKDIGYNFLVDRYGQVFEGRYGGMQRNVIGAHAEGFNTGSVGISVIGNFSRAAVPSVAERALTKLIAWRLDVAHVDPLSTLTWRSYGNARYPAGRAVVLRAVSGHRDTGYTDCPGSRLYARLGTIAAQARRIGLPKLFAPSMQGKLGGPIRFSARLSTPLDWTVTVAKGGVAVARGSGYGTRIAWTWSSPPGSSKVAYAWTIEAGPDVRPASGVIGRGTTPPPPPPAPLLRDLSLAPVDVSPNGDGYADTTTIGYVLSERAQVTLAITDENGDVVQTLTHDQWQSAGRFSLSYAPDALPDGRYTLTVRARSAGGRTASAQAQLSVDRTLAGLTVQPPAFSPNGDGRMDTAALSFHLSRAAQVRIDVKRGARVVATVASGDDAAGEQTVTWDGTTSSRRIADGRYTAVVAATSQIGTTSLARPLRLDTAPPVIRVLSFRRLLFRSSEPARVTLVVNGRTYVRDVRAGVFAIRVGKRVRRVTVSAEDAAGNRSRALRFP
jgi:flagellar hook assembly protein FlgD